MITISKRVEAIVQRWPLIKQGLDLELINLSSLARYIKPEIEAEIGERISEAAVLMALRRYQSGSVAAPSANPSDFLGDMSLRGSLCDLTYANSPTFNENLDKIFPKLNPQLYLTVSRGLMQTSVIAHRDLLPIVEKQLAYEYLETKVSELTAITLHLKSGHEVAVGVLALPLNLLAWRGISVIELVSTFDELNIVLYNKDVEEAFRTLTMALN